MRSFMVILFFSISPTLSFCQGVGIGTTTPDTSAILDLTSTEKGLLVPRLADTTAVALPTAGLVIFNQNMRTLNYHDGVNWRSFNNSSSLSASDSITISINDGPAVRILSYTQEAVHPLAADGRLSGSVVAGIYSFTKKNDPIISNFLKTNLYLPTAPNTKITIRMYSNGTEFFRIESRRSYVYGNKDTYDPVNGYLETYSITANELDFFPSAAQHENGWP